MSQSLGNAALIAGSATFTLLIFQAFAAAPPIDKPLYSPPLIQPQRANPEPMHNPQNQSDYANSPLPKSGY